MKKNPRLPEGDDGRTIVNMNVEGMPWYQKPSPDAPPEGDEPGREGHSNQAPYQMTKEESRMYMWGALKAALLVAMIFAVVFFVFILLLDLYLMR